MTTSPSLELQGAIVARLKADAAVTALIAGRVYDRVPKKTDYPYVSMGPSDELTDDADCITGFDISMQVDVWSTDVGGPEAKRIGDAVRAALHDQDLPIVANNLVYFVHRQTRIFTDADGLTTHAVLTFDSYVEQPQE